MKIDRSNRSPLLRVPGALPDWVELPSEMPPMIACGPETGNTFCLTNGNRAYVSQDIGDLRDASVYDVYLESIASLKSLIGVEPEIAVHDSHPDYVSTRYAQDCGAERLIPVQHHHAHAVACMYENGLSGRVIGITFDGMGLGDDGTIWGGEFLLCNLGDYERKGHMKPYALPGGDQATLNPERMAYSCLTAELGMSNLNLDSVLPGLTDEDKKMILRIVDKGINSPLTSSVGRLFDVVAAMLGFQGEISSPAEAAIGLQAMANDGVNDSYSYEIKDWQLGFGPMFGEILADIKGGKNKGGIAAMFHNTLAQGSIEMCNRIREDNGVDDVVLSGGVFYNSLLSGLIVEGLQKSGFNVYTHALLPPGDVCLSLGQAVIACVKEKLCV
jgi:hydrogenase maturation protein HypF